MATIIVDGRHYEAEEGANLLHAVLSEGVDLPYFCWHPAMGSVGACRQCAVLSYRDADDDRGRLSMACMTAVTDGMRISVEATHAQQFRATVIEWLMENHPHDCPVCEEGGECHLQDMTVQTGHAVRRYRPQKRTWQNQNLGPFIGHEMNRCITCYRCVRFYNDYAGGTDLSAFGSRGRMYFGRVDDGTLASEFAGNLVEVCPTGVFTDKPFSKSYTRKWDLQSAPSVCPGCSIGCNVYASERYSELKRLHNRYHDALNGYFICDRGRFGSHFVNNKDRVRHAATRAADGTFEFGDAEGCVKRAAETIRGGAIGIGSPRASLEANFALKQLVGAENFFAGFSDAERACMAAILGIYRGGGFGVPTLREAEQADAILILGEDISNTAARVALTVRQATRGESFSMAATAAIPEWQDAGVRGHAQHAKSPVFIASTHTTRLHDIAETTIEGNLDELVSSGLDIAGCLQSEATATGISDFAKQAAAALVGAERPLIVSGASHARVDLVEAAASIARALKAHEKDVSLLLTGMEANSFGAALLDEGNELTHALTRMREGTSAVILENDLYRRADKSTVDEALGAAQHIGLDALESATLESMQIVFPAATYAEQTGTFVNFETRAQRFFQVFRAQDEVRPAWQWCSEIAADLERREATFDSLEELLAAFADAGIGGLTEIAPNRDYRVDALQRIPRQTHRQSGRTAMTADIDVHEPRSTVDPETPFAYSMEGRTPGESNASVMPYTWSPGWNSNQSIFKFQAEVDGPLHGEESGVRLLTINSDAVEVNGSVDRPTPRIQSDNALSVIRLHDLFGSDELSSSSWPIAERFLGEYVVLNPVNAEAIGVDANKGVRATALGDGVYAVHIDDAIPAGFVGVSVGTPDTPWIAVDAIELEADPSFVPRRDPAAQVIVRA